MISIYLDWSVMAQMKNGSHPQLLEILRQERFIVPYSTSHIDDIVVSYKPGDEKQQKNIDYDLEFITNLCGQNCLVLNKDQVTIMYHNAKEMFQSRIEDKGIFKDFGLDMLQSFFTKESSTEASLALASFNILSQLPLDDTMMKSLNDPIQGEALEQMFPGLKGNPTMGGFLNSFGAMLSNMNEGESYKDLRKIIQTSLGINRDRMFKEADPFGEINNLYKDKKFSLPELDEKYSPKWFNEISNEYIRLDMHGFQEDRVSITAKRKETFRNTTEDSFHSAFASTCNFYLVSDKKAYEKTQKVFEKLSIRTLVFKPDDFLTYYETYLKPRTIWAETEIPFVYVDHAEFLKSDEGENAFLHCHVPHFVFDFFNKMLIIPVRRERLTMLLLTRFAPTNKNFTYIKEIERLSGKLLEAFGKDIEELGIVTEAECKSDKTKLRTWNCGSLSVRLVNSNGHFQLYFDVPHPSKWSKFLIFVKERRWLLVCVSAILIISSLIITLQLSS